MQHQQQFTITGGGGSILRYADGSFCFMHGVSAVTLPAQDVPAFLRWLDEAEAVRAGKGNDGEENPHPRKVEAPMREQQPPSEATTTGEEDIEPPRPPAGFELRDTPLPLLTRQDERWIARAFCDEGEGVLIYEEDREIIFFAADEALTALYGLVLASWHLIPHCNPELSTLHAELIDALRLFWQEAAEEERQVAAQEEEEDTEGGKESQQP